MTDSIFGKEVTNDLPFSDPNTVTLEDLVGEDKTYKTPEDLAKALAHKENHISKIEKENAVFVANAEKQDAIEEALKKLTEKTKSGEPPIEPAPAEPKPVEQPKASTIGEDDIRRLLNEERQKQDAQANLTKVQAKLIEHTGNPDKAAIFIAEQARSTGMSVKELEDLAQRNPVAFFKLVDIEQKKPDATAQVQTFNRGVQERAPDPERLETFEDYVALRKTNRKKFYQPAVYAKYVKLAEEKRAS